MPRFATCPQCRELVPVERRRPGTMIACPGCLLLFPVPETSEQITEVAPMAEPIDSSVPNLQVIVPRMSMEDWARLKTGLIVIFVGLAILPLMALCLCTMQLEWPGLSRPVLDFLRRGGITVPVLAIILALLVVFTGQSLCLVATMRSHLRNRVIVSMVATLLTTGLLLLTMLIEIQIPNGLVLHRDVNRALEMATLLGGAATMATLVLFFQGISDTLHSDWLTYSTIFFVFFGSFFVASSVCVLISPFNFIVFSLAYLCLIVLVAGTIQVVGSELRR